MWLHQRIMTLQRERETRWQKILKLLPGDLVRQNDSDSILSIEPQPAYLALPDGGLGFNKHRRERAPRKRSCR